MFFIVSRGLGRNSAANRPDGRFQTLARHRILENRIHVRLGVAMQGRSFLFLAALCIALSSSVTMAQAKQRSARAASASATLAPSGVDGVTILAGNISKASSTNKAGQGTSAGGQHQRPLKLRRPRHQLEVRIIKPDGTETVFHGVRERQARAEGNGRSNSNSNVNNGYRSADSRLNGHDNGHGSSYGNEAGSSHHNVLRLRLTKDPSSW